MPKKYFGTDGIRGRVNQGNINGEMFFKFGLAAGTYFKNLKKTKQTAIIAKDTRLSGYTLEPALVSGLASAGMHVYTLGPLPTNGLAMLTKRMKANMGIMITASHNPYFDNGIKIFDSDGNKISDEMQLLIESKLNKEHVIEDSKKLGRLRRIEYEFGIYEDFCERFMSGPEIFSGIKVAMDCANGATYRVAPRILEKTGASLVVVGAKPNGFNINENCGSTDTSVLQKLVIADNADVGIAFDGDGDRLMLVDHEGEIVDGDQIIFALAVGKKKYGTMKGGVVGTHMSNLGLQLALANIDIPFERTEVGDRYVMNALLERDWILGAETSGHILNLEASHTGDAIVAALQILELMRSMDLTLKEIVKEFEKFPQVLINVSVDRNSAWMQSANLAEAVDDYTNQLRGRGRIYIRASGTEPVVRVMVEGNDQQETKNIADDLSRILKNSA